MIKRISIITFFLLTACSKQGSIYCEKRSDDVAINIELQYRQGNIYKIIETETISIPKNILYKQEDIEGLLEKLGEDYTYCDGNIIYQNEIDNLKYNLNKSLQALRRDYFYCD